MAGTHNIPSLREIRKIFKHFFLYFRDHQNFVCVFSQALLYQYILLVQQKQMSFTANISEQKY